MKVSAPDASNPIVSCEGYEVAIEERRLGTLDPSAAARLDAHLAGCASCRAFAAFQRRSEEIMTSNADATLDDHDWAVIKKNLRRAPRRWRDHLLLYAIAFIAATPMIALALGGDVLFMLGTMLVVLPLAFAARFVLDRRLVREMEWIGTREADFFAEYRRLVARGRRMLWTAIVLFPLWALAVDAIGWWVSGPGDALTRTCRVLLVAVASLTSLWLRTVPLRRLDEIRAQLS